MASAGHSWRIVFLAIIRCPNLLTRQFTTISMITSTIRALFQRELRALRREIEAYPDERQLWETPGGVANSAGNLALHVCGNLQHFIGARLGDTGYVRDRDAEFARRGVSRSEILAEIRRGECRGRPGLRANQRRRFDDAIS